MKFIHLIGLPVTFCGIATHTVKRNGVGDYTIIWFNVSRTDSLFVTFNGREL